MYTALIVLILIISVLLVLVVLAQNSKGGGVTSQFGGAGATQMIGAKKTTDLLERVTWGFASGILVLVLFTNFFVNQNGSGQQFSDPNIEKAQQKKTNVPAQQQKQQPSKDAKPTDEGKTEKKQEEKK